MSFGITLPNGCQIVHGAGSNVKRPFADMPLLEMHELDPGTESASGTPAREVLDGADAAAPRLAQVFHGQLGFIPFTTSIRLPRHVHIATSPATSSLGKDQDLVTERILVLDGVALVQLNGLTYVIPPGSLVTIGPGVPHTWTACPPHVKMPDGEVSQGRFLMVYEYEQSTGFFPTDGVDTLRSAREYVEYKGDLDRIRFPAMTAADVVREGKLVWGREVMSLEDSLLEV